MTCQIIATIPISEIENCLEWKNYVACSKKLKKATKELEISGNALMNLKLNKSEKKTIKEGLKTIFSRSNFRGKGTHGNEEKIAEFFGDTLKLARLSDAVDCSGQRIDYKKTQNKRIVLDLIKLVCLTPEESNIIVRFIRFDGKNGNYMMHRDLTYGELLKVIPLEEIRGAQAYVKEAGAGTKSQILYKFQMGG